MRLSLGLLAVLAACGLGLALPAHAAGPARPDAAFSTAKSLVQPAQIFRRRYPPGYVPPQVYVPPPAVVPGAVVVQPEVIIVPPPRPASCGEFRFWNGVACVDARYNKPYLGPRP